MYKKINHIGRPFCIFSLSLTFVHKKVFYVFLPRTLYITSHLIYFFFFNWRCVFRLFFFYTLLVFHVVSPVHPQSSQEKYKKEKFSEVEMKSSKKNFFLWLIHLMVYLFWGYLGKRTFLRLVLENIRNSSSWSQLWEMCRM